jgi:hypothetical protein
MDQRPPASTGPRKTILLLSRLPLHEPHHRSHIHHQIPGSRRQIDVRISATFGGSNKPFHRTKEDNPAVVPLAFTRVSQRKLKRSSKMLRPGFPWSCGSGRPLIHLIPCVGATSRQDDVLYQEPHPLHECPKESSSGHPKCCVLACR